MQKPEDVVDLSDVEPDPVAVANFKKRLSNRSVGELLDHGGIQAEGDAP